MPTATTAIFFPLAAGLDAVGGAVKVFVPAAAPEHVEDPLDAPDPPLLAVVFDEEHPAAAVAATTTAAAMTTALCMLTPW
jgi:hypothetical protein